MYIRTILISIIMTALLYSGGYYDTSNPVETIEEPVAVQGTFEEFVTDKYLERARSEEIDKLYMIRDNGVHKHVIKSSNDLEIIHKVLDYFNNLNLVAGSPGPSNSSVNKELFYEVWFENTKKFEKINISTNGDNELHTYIIFHIISEDKEKKIISHERDYVIEYYTIFDGTIDFDFLDKIFESIEEKE